MTRGGYLMPAISPRASLQVRVIVTLTPTAAARGGFSITASTMAGNRIDVVKGLVSAT